jgi:putative salt-induced outer membrane protein YdiY
MKNVTYALILICLTVLSSGDVLSHDKNSSTPQKSTKNDAKLPVSGEVSLDFLRSKGNIDERAIGYGLSLKIKGMANNEVFLKIEGDKGEIQHFTYTDELEVSALDIYHLNDISGLYGKVTYYRNEPRGYKYQKRIGGGYLHTFYQNDLDKNKLKKKDFKLKEKYFKARIGYQHRSNRYTTNVDDNQDYLQLGCRLKHPLMKNISLFTEVNYMIDFSDSKDYEIENLLSFVFYVNKKIDIKIEYERLYSNIPVFEKQKTDSSFGTSLIYKF